MMRVCLVDSAFRDLMNCWCFSSMGPFQAPKVSNFLTVVNAINDYAISQFVKEWKVKMHCMPWGTKEKKTQGIVQYSSNLVSAVSHPSFPETLED